jgi:hypothetical protein
MPYFLPTCKRHLGTVKIEVKLNLAYTIQIFYLLLVVSSIWSVKEQLEQRCDVNTVGTLG